MTKRIVTVDTATGAVLGQWMGGDEQTLRSVQFRTHIVVPPDDTDYSRKRWNGTAFEALPLAPSPVLLDASALTDRQLLELVARQAGVAR